MSTLELYSTAGILYDEVIANAEANELSSDEGHTVIRASG